MRHQLIRALAVALSVSPLFGQKWSVAPDEGDKQGTLELLFVDSFGHTLDDSSSANVSIERLPNRSPLLRLRAPKRVTLQYGSYRVAVQMTGAYPIERTVNIRQPAQAVIFCMWLAPIEVPWDGNLVRGRLTGPSKAKRCTWLRLVSPFADEQSFDARASTEGAFYFENVRPGKYIVMTIGDDGVCANSTVTITGERLQDITVQ